MNAAELLSLEYEQIARAVKSIGTSSLGGGGKLKPAQNAPKEVAKDIRCGFLEIDVSKADKQIVTGVVLKPEVVDAQGDIMSAEVIAEAAFNFLAGFNKKTKLGLQHNSFMKNEKRFELIESYIAPIDFVLGTTSVKKGTWLMSVRVLDAKIWKDVKDGKITGFSIGGKARAVAVAPKTPQLGSLAA